MQKDMTRGPIVPIILHFLFPMFVGNVFQQLYNMADMIIVGRYVGAGALAAVGSTGTLMFLVLGFALGITAGFGILTSQRFGAKDEAGVRRSVANGTLLALLLSLAMTLLSTAAVPWLLDLLNTPADIMEDARAYITIIFQGLFTNVFYNMASVFLRSVGNSKAPLFFLVFSACLNVGLDLLCIIQFHMGVAGAALATVISQGISAVLCLIYMIRHYPILHMKQDEWKPDGRMLRTLCGMGIPMGLQYSITAIGSVVLQTAVNSLGSMAVAAVSTGSKVSMFFCCPFDALGGTMATYAGQNVGAKKLNRIRDGLKTASMIGIAYSLIAFVILFFGGKYIALLFMDADQTEIIGRVAMFLIGNSMFYIPLTFVNVVRFTIQGMGFSTFAILAGVCEMAARSLVGFCLVPVFGFLPACFASPLAWIFADAFLLPAFFHCMKKLRKLFGETA